MDYYKKLQRYLTATTNTLQSSYEWYVKEYNKKDNDVSYLAAISCIESYKDDMQGAVAFAHFSDLISEEQFNEAWDLAQSVYSAYSVKIWDLFFKIDDIPEQPVQQTVNNPLVFNFNQYGNNGTQIRHVENYYSSKKKEEE